MDDYPFLLGFGLLGVLMAGGALVASRILAPRGPDLGAKREPYESGEKPFGDARFPFRIGYYLLALAFLLFEVETLFLFPALSVLREAQASGALPLGLVMGEILIFMLLLGAAWAYAWKQGALEWE
jgi:NADH-quinone oxidoreductase subunit A